MGENSLKALLPEYPILVLPSLAVAIGLNEAITLQQIHYWLGHDGKQKDGKLWIYNSYPQWQKNFPWWSLRTIQRNFLSLQKQGLIEVNCHNRKTSDRTKWYTIVYDKIPSVNLALSSRQNGTMTTTDWHIDNDKVAHSSIPETTTETTTEKESAAPTASSEKKVKKEKKPTNPDIKTFIDYAFESVTSRQLPKLKITGREAKEIGQLLERVGLEAALPVWDRYLEWYRLGDKPIRSAGISLLTFCHKFERLQTGQPWIDEAKPAHEDEESFWRKGEKPDIFRTGR